MIYRILFIWIGLLCFRGLCYSQTETRLEMTPDSSRMEMAADSTVRSVIQQVDSLPFPDKVEFEFKPDPKKAVLMALVPGLGQIYNRKYWKLPIVYGGLMGCMYAVTWNNKTYKDYSEAYLDLMNDAQQPGRPASEYHQSWKDFLSPQADPEEYVTDTNFQEQLKRGKDRYRRWRDMSIFITIGVYALSIIDAYVDAQLFDFDISPDLSMHWGPEVTLKTRYTSSSYGLNCSIKF